MEMIVAFSIAAFMIFVFHAIFNEASNAARRGVQTSDFIHKSMAIEEHLQNETSCDLKPGDFDTTTSKPTPVIPTQSHMLGPLGSTDDPQNSPIEPGGILIIVQHRFDGTTGNGIPMRSDADADREPDVQYLANVRSDQLLFVYDQSDGYGKKLTPIAPSSEDDLGGNLDDTSNSNYVRVWYGHAALTDSEGNYNDSGSPDVDDLGVTGGANQYPINWTLARHAMFFMVDSDRNGLVETPAENLPRTDYYSQGIFPDSNVHDYNQQVYLGLADVTNQSWESVTYNNLPLPNESYLGSNNSSNSSSGAYNARAALLAFVNYRMRVNPAPNLNSSTSSLSNFTCRTAARTHPIFINNVSDFVVEFAHDYFTDQDYNVTSPRPDGKIDTYYNDAGELQIRWYSWFPNHDSHGGTSDSDRAYASNPDYPVTWLPPTTNNPAFLNGTSAGYPYADAVFVWGQADPLNGSYGYENHAHEPTNPLTNADTVDRWPWLLRIRYRLHDRSGEFRGRTLNDWSGATDPKLFELGQWFEVIVPVNHQAASTP